MLLMVILPLVKAQEVYVGSYEVGMNEEFLVPVYVKAPKEIVGVLVTLKFDPNVVSVLNVSLNKSYECKQGCIWFKDVSSDSVRFVIIDKNGLNFEGGIVDVKFKAVGLGESELKISASMSSPNELIKPNVSGGYVKIQTSKVKITTVVTTQVVTTQSTQTTVTTKTVTTKPTGGFEFVFCVVSAVVAFLIVRRYR